MAQCSATPRDMDALQFVIMFKAVYLEGFARPWPLLGTGLSMVASVVLLGIAVRTLPVGPAYAVWTATTTFDRLHQVRVHAAESGLPIVGESRYAKTTPIFLSEIKRNYRPAGDGTRVEPPLYGELCLHLARIAFPGADGKPVVVEAPLPKPFAVLLKKLAEHRPG